MFKSASSGDVAVKMGKITVTNEELLAPIKAQVYEAEKKIFDMKMDRVRAVLLKKIMESDPRKKGLTNDEYLRRYIGKGDPVTDQDIEKFIKSQGFPQSQVNEMFKKRVKDYLKVERKQQAVQEWLTKKSKKDPIEIFIQRPRRPFYEVKVGSSVQTSPNAKVTLVEFSDFQCPYCAKAAETLKQIKKKYGAKVNVVFKHFPLPMHPDAKRASMAAMCALDQGADKFWDFHDWMFAHQQDLKNASIKQQAKKFGLDTSKFNDCVDNNKYLAAVNNDIDQGKELEIRATPTFFVNGKLVSGARSLEDFSEVIDEELGL